MQNTFHEGDAPIPTSTNAASRSRGTALARVTPAMSTTVPTTSRTPRSASATSAAPRSARPSDTCQALVVDDARDHRERSDDQQDGRHEHRDRPVVQDDVP